VTTNSPPARASTLSTPNPAQNSAPSPPPVGLPTNPSANQGVQDPNSPSNPNNPANPNNPLNPNNPANPNSPLNPNNPANPNSPLNPNNPANLNSAQNPTNTAVTTNAATNAPNVTAPTAPLPASAITGTPNSVPSRTESLSTLDRNRDGYISAEELTSNAQARTVVAHCDTDRDGKIASYEYSSCVNNQQK
jgi:hypothetical protein